MEQSTIFLLQRKYDIRSQKVKDAILSQGGGSRRPALDESADFGQLVDVDIDHVEGQTIGGRSVRLDYRLAKDLEILAVMR